MAEYMAKFELRDYQRDASNAGVSFFQRKYTKRNGILVLPTGSGKSLIIADIASKLKENVLVLQPSKEILEQNYSKLLSYGITDCSIYSASLRKKQISTITFATIGSVMSKMSEFNIFRYIIVDECHQVNSTGGQYKDLFDATSRRILGLTATPYRLTSQQITVDDDGHYNPESEPQNVCILKFLTRTRPRVFHDVLYQVSIQTLLKRGYLAHLRYFDLTLIDQQGLKRNSTGMDYDDTNLQNLFYVNNFYSYLVSIVNRVLNPKDGKQRRGVLVFTKFLKESEELCKSIEGCVMISGSTKKKEREKILKEFKEGKIKVVANVGVLTTGFDYPELDTVIIARPTMSLAMYYQIVGRVIRPYPGKDAWVVDLCGNVKRFGKVEDLYLTEPKQGEYMIRGLCNGTDKQLTNIYF